MTPIAKNIIVADENGNEYEATYPKRAEGLVKKGRARFIDDNKICMLCPPEIKTEDDYMSENIDKIEPIEPKSAERLTIDYCLAQIEKLHNELTDLKNTVNNIGCVSDGNRCEDDGVNVTVHDEVAIAKIKALTEVFHHREESLQKLLSIYEKMYDDLKPEKAPNTERIALLGTVIENLSDGMTPCEAKEALTEILSVSLQDLSKNF